MQLRERKRGMALGGEGLWCGASLRPWQILHSRLARMHTCALLERDVWELMDETVEAAIYNPLREEKKEELPVLEGYDGELWRHGGLMEARIRDWLTSKIEEESKEAPITLHPNYYDNYTPATFSSECCEIPERRLEEHIAGDAAYFLSEEVDVADGGDHGYVNTNSIATCSSDSSETGDSTILEAAVYAAVANALDSCNYEDEEEEEEEKCGYIGANMTNAAILKAPQYDTETHDRQFTQDLQANDELHEQDEPLCAVCLEKLYINEELMQGCGVNDITYLPCCHSFHSQCLTPWLSASSMCPCCRGPTTRSCPLNLEGPLNLGVARSGGANCSDRVQLEMMGLVAEVEAALDRLGLLS